ncbi:hypothetical protein Pla175_24590 [Pirellulimonas nuda]|uniref:Uncharacterized protein n=1 Tax=Pirellulimonas nuda TaxID=2528009 RepID=A0A518DC85_9BACT|nr:hypothetical protein Pla175_24590 [Pirellulimonas nuda]
MAKCLSMASVDTIFTLPRSRRSVGSVLLE